jgi:peptide/nickel transport system permease protein
MADPSLALDPASAPVPGPIAAAPEKQRVYVASQWQLMWWRFRKHRVAMVSGVVVI